MAQKYTKGNTRVLLDLGPLYSRLTSYALEVGISLSAVIRIILNDAIIRGTVILPPLDGSRSSALDQLDPDGSIGQRVNPMATPTSEHHRVSDPFKERTLVEGIHGTWHYHYSDDERTALCGAMVMPSGAPESTWGYVSDHLHEQYCAKCFAIRNKEPDKQKLAEEAIQVAAMALRNV